MARVLMATQPWGVIQRRDVNGVVSASAAKTVHMANLDSSAATTWTAQTGGSSTTADTVTDANGAMPNWIEEGEYDQTIDGVTKRVEATSGATRAVQSFASIDLCRPWGTSMGVSPGDEITTQLQAAITYIAANYTNGGEVYFSKPGTYLISGSQQTGTAFSYSYSGQILFPATADRSHEYCIRIRGPVRANSSNDADSTGYNGVVLQSNATSGNVFDCVPGFTAFSATYGWTGVQPAFEDVVVLCPSNPQCGGIAATVCFRFSCRNLTITTTDPTVAQTGAGVALALPQTANSGDTSVDAQIVGFPVGVDMSEHAVLQRLYVGRCGVAFRGSIGASHVNKFVYVSAEECPTVFKTVNPGGLNVEGFLDWENVVSDSFIQGPFIDEWNNGSVWGVLTLNPNNAQSTTYQKGFPLKGGAGIKGAGKGLDLIYLPLGTPGWKGRHPSDDFKRLGASTQTGEPGSCSTTLHPWRTWIGSGFTNTSQVCKGLSAAGGNYALLPAIKKGVSRVITGVFTTGASFSWCGLVGNCPVNSSGQAINAGNGGLRADIRTSSPFVALYVNNVAVVSITTVGTIVINTTYTLALEFFNGPDGIPAYANVYLNGAKVITYTLTAAQRTAITPPTNGVYPYVEDGFFTQEAISAIGSFVVRDAHPGPASVASAQATLAAGTVVIADTRITASSIVRVSNIAAGGTVGALSVVLNAGVGFTINSTSGTDTSTVYYEIVSF